MDIDITETINELEDGNALCRRGICKFEKAALLRDQIKELKHMIDGAKPGGENSPAKPASYRKSRKTRGRFGFYGWNLILLPQIAIAQTSHSKGDERTEAVVVHIIAGIVSHLLRHRFIPYHTAWHTV